MARTDTLGNFLTDVAESIRTKTGETGTILASEFDTKIKNIQGGGAAEDLTEELTEYNTELVTQETTIEDIIVALENKSAVGDTTIIQNQQTFSIDDFVQAGATYTTDGYVMLCTLNRTTQFNGVYLKNIEDGTYYMTLTTDKKTAVDSAGNSGVWYTYRYEDDYFYVVNFAEKTFFKLSTNNTITQITTDGEMLEAIPAGATIKIVVNNTTQNIYVDDVLFGTLTNTNTIGAAHAHASYDGSGFIVFTGLRKIIETVSENDPSLNLYVQTDEPETKKGLWVKTDTLQCEYIIKYDDSTNNDSHNNALIFKLNNRQRIYYTDLYNIGSKTFAFTDIDYYSESTGYTQDIELYYGDDKKWILVKTPLPDEYTRISAIHNGGNAYINSGVIPNADTGFDIDFLVHSGYGPYAIFGSRVTYKSQVFQYAIWQPRAEFKGTLTVGTDTTNDGWNIRYDAGITGNIRYSTSLYSNDKYVQPSGDIVRVKSNPQINTTFPIYIACLNEGNKASEFSTVTIYSLKFYNKDIIVRNFIPVTTLVNGSEIAGLYDLIDGVFYKSSNSYNFTKVV